MCVAQAWYWRAARWIPLRSSTCIVCTPWPSPSVEQLYSAVLQSDIRKSTSLAPPGSTGPQPIVLQVLRWRNIGGNVGKDNPSPGLPRCLQLQCCDAAGTLAHAIEYVCSLV